MKQHRPNMPRGTDHWQWKGGRRAQSRGYVAVLAPESPRAVHGYVLEHIYLAERALGHPLPPRAEVHHVNGDKKDNTAWNLVVCEDHAYHMMLHRRQRALRECGDANAHRCGFCKRYDRQDDITVQERRADGRHAAYHRACNAEHQRMRNARLRQRAG